MRELTSSISFTAFTSSSFLSFDADLSLGKTAI